MNAHNLSLSFCSVNVYHLLIIICLILSFLKKILFCSVSNQFITQIAKYSIVDNY